MIERKIKCAAWVMAITVLTAGCGADDSESRPLDIDDVSVTSEAENVQNITLDEAKAAVLSHAGLSGDNVVFIKTMLENDDGKATYDIKFTADNSKYEYEIDAVSGTVLEFSSEIISDKTVDESYYSAETSGQITIDEAKVIALKHAGISESLAVFTKTKSDYDDGIVKYDIKFRANNTEYEYKIRASDGAVLENSAETIEHTIVVAWGNITLDEAKAVALKNAGFTEEQVLFTKSELDHDDGMTVYEIEFNVNGIEYEYKIYGAGD